jgi:hypothetical protein
MVTSLAPTVHDLISALLPWLSISDSEPPPSEGSTPLRPQSPAPALAPSADALFAAAHPPPRLFDLGSNYLVVPDLPNHNAVVRLEPDVQDDYSSWYYRVKFFDGRHWSPPLYLTFDDAKYEDAPLLSIPPLVVQGAAPTWLAFLGAGTISLPDHALWSTVIYPNASFSDPEW